MSVTPLPEPRQSCRCSGAISAGLSRPSAWRLAHERVQFLSLRRRTDRHKSAGAWAYPGTGTEIRRSRARPSWSSGLDAIAQYGDGHRMNAGHAVRALRAPERTTSARIAGFRRSVGLPTGMRSAGGHSVLRSPDPAWDTSALAQGTGRRTKKSTPRPAARFAIRMPCLPAVSCSAVPSFI